MATTKTTARPTATDRATTRRRAHRVPQARLRGRAAAAAGRAGQAAGVGARRGPAASSSSSRAATRPARAASIKRVTEYLNARVARIVALPAPTERERTQWYFQRYVAHLPAGGEIVLFDRSWYNRAGVERVMGFCTDDEYHRFLHQCPTFERMLVEDGILLRKYWFSVSDEEQEARFHSRIDDPMRFWKLSPMDLKSITHWEDYSRAKDEMMVHTEHPRGAVVHRRERRQAGGAAEHDRPPPGVDRLRRRRAGPTLKLPKRPKSSGYERPPRDLEHYVPDHAATLDLTLRATRVPSFAASGPIAAGS